MCNAGNILHDLAQQIPGNKFASETRVGDVLTGGVARAVNRNNYKIPGFGSGQTSIDDLAAVGTGDSKTYQKIARGVGALFGLYGAAVGGGGGAAGEAAAPTGEVATSTSTAATGTTPAATQGTVALAGDTSAPAAGTTAGSVAGPKGGMTITDMVRLGASIAGIAGSAASIAAASKVKPPEVAPTPPAPQPGKEPDLAAISARTKAMFGAGGPFAGSESTFLTGPGGIPPASLNIGKNILLGS